MKQYVIGFLLIVSISACGQENNEIQHTLKQIIQHTEEASLYRDNVDWDTLRPNIYKRAKTAKSIADLKPALVYMLKSVGDEHGRIIHNNQILAYYNTGELKAHQQSYQSQIYKNVQMGKVYQFHTEMLDNHTGYVRIVGLPMGDNEKMASEIQSAVCQLIADGAKDWIVDLRYNGGGNMHPMAEGIATIIGNGKVGGSKGLNTDQNSIWRIEDNDFYYDDYSIALKEDCQVTANPKIAVLTSLYTASSGEALAVIFKGREDTKFFGQKTFGLITVTDWNMINDSTAMTISVSYYKDRNEVVYDKYVDVDIEMPFEEEPLSENDQCLHAALDWVNKE